MDGTRFKVRARRRRRLGRCLGVAMCDEVIFRGRYIRTIEDLRKALDGGEIVPSRQYDYTDDDLLPHCCLCPVDLAQTAAKNGMRLWPSSEGEGVWYLSKDATEMMEER